MVIKSSVLAENKKSIWKKNVSKNILFNPEFLKAFKELYENIYP